MIEPIKIVILLITLIMAGGLYIIFMSKNLVNRNQAYTKLIDLYNEKYLKDSVWCKVRFSSEKHFFKKLKLTPWNGSGLLVLKDNQAIFLYSLREDANKMFNIKNSILKWVGIRKIYNGVFSWFCIENNGEQIYFTSETGFLSINSDKSTKKIFEHIKKWS